MKYLIHLTFAIILLFTYSCKKEQNLQYAVVPKPANVVLNIDKKINDSTLVLKWNKATLKGFKSYTLKRSAKVFKNGLFTNVTESLLTTTDANMVTYTDNTMPFARDIVYNLSVVTDSVNNNTLSSLVYKRENAFASARFSDMLVDKLLKKLFVIDQSSGSIKYYNYVTQKLIASVSIGEKVGCSALGSYLGTNNELYLPTSDGWLYILDAETLATKERIYVGGYEVGSVIAGNNKIIVSSSDMVFGTPFSNSIKIYDRATLKVLGRTGFWNNTRLLALGEQINEFVDITFTLSPGDLSYYKIDNNGTSLVKKSDNYHADYPLDPNLMRSFPDGNRLITGTAGSVYRKDLVYEKDIAPRYSQKYSDFTFNTDGSVIYASYRTEKKIDEITYPSVVLNRTINTKLYPAFVFRDGNNLYCLTTETSTYKNNEVIMFIEKFEL